MFYVHKTNQQTNSKDELLGGVNYVWNFYRNYLHCERKKKEPRIIHHNLDALTMKSQSSSTLAIFVL